jgi:hypothetical protein
MPQHEVLEPEVYGLKPKSVDWPVDHPRKENWVKRFGFSIVPDFAATVHAVTGGQLPTAIGELDTYEVAPTQEDALKGYIVLSRVEKANNIAIAQPSSPVLFRQGPLESAELLLDVLRGNVPREDLEQRWEQIEERRRKRKNKLIDQTWKCVLCAASWPWAAYALELEGDVHALINEYVLKPGGGRCCKRCLPGEPNDSLAAGHHPRTATRAKVVCKICKDERDTEFYDLAKLRALQEAVCEKDAVCLQCDPGELLKFYGRVIKCAQPRCGEEYLFEEYRIPEQRRMLSEKNFKTQTHACHSCQSITCSWCDIQKAKHLFVVRMEKD